MSGQSTVLKWDTLRSLSSASVSGTYATIGTAISFPARIIKIINDSNQAVTISVDGTNDFDYVPAGGFFLYDCGTNRGNASPEMVIQKGTQFFAKGTAGTGTVALVVLYAYTSQSGLPGTADI